MSETRDVMLSSERMMFQDGDNPLFDDGVYTIVENPKENDAGVRINISEYKGLVFQYGRVSFVEGEKELQFERNIRWGGEIYEDRVEDLYTDMQLQALMGDILVELIMNQVRQEQKEVIDKIDVNQKDKDNE